jgi:hypothetical protein
VSLKKAGAFVKNPKSEARNPKQIQMSEEENPKRGRLDPAG